MKGRYKKIDFDKLQLYFGEPFVIDNENAEGSITIYQPTIGSIMRIGEKKFYQTLNIFVSNTTSYRLLLWKVGIDWNNFSDFNLFLMLYKQIDPDVSKLLFGDLDWSKFDVSEKKLNDTSEAITILYNYEDGIEINEEIYQCIHQYLQTMFGIFPDEKITSDPILKQWYINKDERQISANEFREARGEDLSVSMLSMISSCVNHPGFKYKAKELIDVGVCEFYDSVRRLQVYESATAVLKGMCSGFVDSKSISPESYNFMKNI